MKKPSPYPPKGVPVQKSWDEIRVDLESLAEALKEKRSDISETLQEYLETGKMELSWLETRHVWAPIPPEVARQPNLVMGYDTLTTLLEYTSDETEYITRIEDGYEYT